MKHLHLFEQFITELRMKEKPGPIRKYTVVSQDANSPYQWGIVDDVNATGEQDAIKQGQKIDKKYGSKSKNYKAFLADSDELEQFIDDNDFID